MENDNIANIEQLAQLLSFKDNLHDETYIDEINKEITRLKQAIKNETNV